jgi:hypothetical protein
MFRFTIRDLLWLMVVVGMGVGWWLDRAETIRLREDSKLWETRAMQLESTLKSQTGAVVEFLPTKTNITFGKKSTE